MANRTAIKAVAKAKERAEIERRTQEFLARGGAVKEHGITERAKSGSERFMLRRYPGGAL